MLSNQRDISFYGADDVKIVVVHKLVGGSGRGKGKEKEKRPQKPLEQDDDIYQIQVQGVGDDEGGDDEGGGDVRSDDVRADVDVGGAVGAVGAVGDGSAKGGVVDQQPMLL